MKLNVTWIAHACFLLEYENKCKIRVVVDPFLEVLGDRKKEWIEKLRDVDLVLITHSHFDHMGNACDVLVENPKAIYVAIYEIANAVANKCKVPNEFVGMNIGGTWVFKKDDVKVPITLVQSVHSSDIGAPTGFVIRFPDFSVYHTGDTGLFTEMSLIGSLYKVKLVLLPIGGHFTMGVDEAVEAVKLIKPKYVIPMHYGTWPLIEADPNVFKARVEEATEAKVIILKWGETHTFEL